MTSAADLPDTLPSWLALQRWYGAKGSDPQLEQRGGWEIDSGDIRLVTHYLLDRATDPPTLYQVPLTMRSHPLDGLEPVGRVADAYVYDAPHDPAFAPLLLQLVLGELTVQSVRGAPQPGAADLVVASSQVLRGEQSNTSIICEVANGAPVILKLFRAIHHGENPDVVLQSAIAAAGSRRVPASVGSLSGSWHDSAQPDGMATGHLAFVQEFLPGVEDAWRVALRAAEALDDFSERSYDLGVATAEVHATLAEALPTRPPLSGDLDAIVTSMRERLAAAVAEVPGLASHAAQIDRVFDAARAAPWPDLQRIHGDYHLGQVLAVPGRGWVLLDFEGEPLRPMHERSQLDVPLRDVAGMLRSFDYVAGSVALTRGIERPVDWSSAARRAFVDGYIARSGWNVREHRALLDAFELDKALYEAVYEARNRPGWLDIPSAAIRRLAERAAAAL